MDDAISRQAVLKLLSTIPPEEAMTKAMLIQSVKQMDVAQPEKRTEERTEKHACDCISRQAAIDAVSDCGICIQRIVDLPSAQPERKRGKWIDDGDPFMWVCGCCGYRVKRYNNTRYCPNCGADMREVDDGRPD